MFSKGSFITWWKKHVGRGSLPNMNGSNPLYPTQTVSSILVVNPLVSGSSPLVVEPTRRRRRRRRTASIVGLPVYSQDPHDAEMTLFKGSIDYDSENEDEDDEDEEGEEREERDLDGPSDSTSSLNRLSSEGRTSLSTSSPLQIPTILSHSIIISNDEETETESIIHTPTNSIPMFRHQTSNSISSQTSPPSSPLQEVNTNLVGVGRTRASTLRSIFNRNNSSSGSLPLSIGGGRSPYGQGTSLPRNASSTSISSLNISSPIPNTLISTNFVYPKAGVTPEQFSFLSSTESLGKYGYGIGAGADVPPAFTPEIVDPIIRPIGRNRGSSVSSNSPLRVSSSNLNSNTTTAISDQYSTSPLSTSGSNFPSNSTNRNSLISSPRISESFLSVPNVDGIGNQERLSGAVGEDEEGSYFPKSTDSKFYYPDSNYERSKSNFHLIFLASISLVVPTLN